MKVGDLVKVDDRLSFAAYFFDVIGIIVQEKGDVCSVTFPSLDGEIKSFMKRDLEIVSENKWKILTRHWSFL